MGLIRTAIQAGAMYGIAREGIKAYEKHNNNNNNTSQGTQAPSQPSYPQQQPPRAANRDIAGYAHQSWCNGQCGRQCNGTTGYAHQGYCNGQCGGRCNGDQSGSEYVRALDSQSQFVGPREDEKPPKY